MDRVVSAGAVREPTKKLAYRERFNSDNAEGFKQGAMSRNTASTRLSDRRFRRRTQASRVLLNGCLVRLELVPEASTPSGIFSPRACATARVIARAWDDSWASPAVPAMRTLAQKPPFLKPSVFLQERHALAAGKHLLNASAAEIAI
jgi:hypothetical protein